MNRPGVIDFVKGALGCTCPDEVFNHVTSRTNESVRYCQSGISKIEVGERLLIHLLLTDDPAVVERDLPLILRGGMEERDRRGFNRFRAVVCTGNREAIASAINKVCENRVDEDERVHLHVVSRESARAVYEPPAVD